MTFSRREGYAAQPAPITVREDAPVALRHAVVRIAAEVGFEASSVRRDVICRVLRTHGDPSNWSKSYIENEVFDLICNCKWYRVYDIAEEFYAEAFRSSCGFSGSSEGATEFEDKINEVLYEEGIGWKMESGKFVYRGDQPYEDGLKSAQNALHVSGRTTALKELVEARRALSRRPEPDRTGAIARSMTALECVAKNICDDSSKTLGDLISSYRTKLAIPPPLDVAIEKVWGYASQFGRHVREGREPSNDEAELVTTLAAAVVTYLVNRHGAGEGEMP